MITAQSDLYLLIGNPVSHSLSPIFQNAAFTNYKINGVYIAINIEKEDFKTVINALKCLNIKGMNITIPYKIDIIEYLDEIEEEAKIINSVNTIKVNNKKWIGYNTDWYGVVKTLEINNIKKNCNVLIIGAGGATNGVVYGLKQYGIKKITITNRSPVKAEEIAKRFNTNILDFIEYLNKIKDYNFIINTTSIDFTKLIDRFERECLYFDIKYYSKNLDTPNFLNGKDMLLYQGAKAFEIWTNIFPSIDILKNSLINIKDL